MSIESKLQALQYNHTTWEQPKVYQLQDGQNEELEELMDRGEVSYVQGVSSETIDELAEMRYPVKLHSEDVRDKYRTDLLEQGLDYGKFVAFDDQKGGKELVHYPPEDDHTDLLHWRHMGRMTREQQQKIYKGITGAVFGLSVGSSIAHSLVRSGVGDTMIIADSDILSPSNLGRTPYDMKDVGRPKADLAADKMTRINPYVRVIKLGEGYADDTNTLMDTEKPSFIVEEVDDPGVKAKVEEYSSENGIPVFTVADIQSAVLEVRRHDLETLRPFGGRLSKEQYDGLRSGKMTDKERMRAMVRIVGTLNVLTDTELLESMMDPTTGGFPQLNEIVNAGAALTTSAVVATLTGRKMKTGMYTYSPNRILELGHPRSAIERVGTVKKFISSSKSAQ